MIPDPLPELIPQAIAKPLALSEKHIPLATEQHDIVGQRSEHVIWRNAWTQPGMREIEARGLEVRVVEELSEDGGKLLVFAGAGLASLFARLRVVGWRVEGDYAADFDFGVDACCGYGDGTAVFVRGDEGEGGGACLAEHGDAVEAGSGADEGDA